MPAAPQDLNSLGYFSPPLTNSVGEPYDTKDPSSKDSRYKGLQFKAGCSKKETFAKFESLYTNEPYVEMETIARRERLAQTKKCVVNQPFRPSSPPKKATGPGLLSPSYGTLGKFEYKPETAPKKVDPKSIKHEKRNIYTSPAKRGSGYSYNGITIGRVPEYIPEPLPKEGGKKERNSLKPFVSTSHSLDSFDRNEPYKYEPGAFSPSKDKAKKPSVKPFVPSSPSKGGKVGGTFSPFPEYKPLEENKGTKVKRSSSTPIFRPTSTPKSTVTRSIAFYRMK
ncbi:hypothetical protein P9112_014650 [Eukaryota sp. TZLM1-RC]